MLQHGRVGAAKVRAWATGARFGYSPAALPLKARLGIQVDVATGDRHPGDATLGTFNPLFPNGYYFTLGGFTGYSNLIHVKPSLTRHPSERLSVATAGGLQWRLRRADAIFMQPVRPVAGTAGRGSRWTGGLCPATRGLGHQAPARGRPRSGPLRHRQHASRCRWARWKLSWGGVEVRLVARGVRRKIREMSPVTGRVERGDRLQHDNGDA